MTSTLLPRYTKLPVEVRGALSAANPWKGFLWGGAAGIDLVALSRGGAALSGDFVALLSDHGGGAVPDACPLVVPAPIIDNVARAELLGGRDALSEGPVGRDALMRR